TVVQTENVNPPRILAADSCAATVAIPTEELNAVPVRISSSRIGSAKRIYWLSAAALFAVAAIAVWYWWRPSSDAQLRTIAVLPFKMLARNDANQALALGMTDALITKMSGLPMIIVRPTSSVTKYVDADPIAAGRELAVEAVLDGRVQQ